MVVAQIAFAWLYSHIFEYFIHKYILHNYKFFKKPFKNHFKLHHGISRKNKMYDENYEKLIGSKFEFSGLIFLLFLHLPFVFFFKWFYFTLIFSACTYYFLHKKSHTNVTWGKKWLPWHYEHHMGKNQNINWGVRLPIVDKIMKTSDY